MMVTDMVMARELTYFAARAKDIGKRCDIEAGMAKLPLPASPGPMPMPACKFTAAMAMRWNMKSAGCCAMRAS